jgi:hypothetical protein
MGTMIRKMLVYCVLGAVVVGAGGWAYQASSDPGFSKASLAGDRGAWSRGGDSNRHVEGGGRPHNGGQEARHERD